MAEASQARTRRAVVAVACNACRSRKSKCDGRRPTCSSCEVRATDCEYASGPSETHGQALKRRYAAVEWRLAVCTEFIVTLQSAELQDALRALSLLRVGADVESVLRQIRTGDPLSELSLDASGHMCYQFPFRKQMPERLLDQRHNTYLGSSLWEGVAAGTSTEFPTLHESQQLHPVYLVPFHATQLVEPELENAKAMTWTSIIHDDSVFRELIRIYFLHHYSFSAFFAKDNFLSNLRSGKDEFCSPLLVHAMLASAIHGHGDTADRADFWDPETIGYKLEAETKRLWDIESISPTLATVQATMVIVINCMMNSNDRIGWRYLEDAVNMAQSLNLFTTINDGASNEWHNSAHLTAWNLFALQGTFAFHIHRPPLLKDAPEKFPDLMQITRFTGEIWVRYPLATSLVPLYLSITIQSLLQFRHCLSDIAECAFRWRGDNDGLSLEEALNFRERLKEWWDNLPSPLTSENIATPCHLKLHLHYHNVMLLLITPFADLYLHGRETPSPTESTLNVSDHPLDVLMSSSICMETLVRLYYLRHGFTTWDSMMPHFISSVGFHAISQLASLPNAPREPSASPPSRSLPSRPDLLSTIILCVKGMYDQGKNMYFSEVVYRLLRNAMDFEDLHLLKEFANIEHEEERAALMIRHVHSSWPIKNARITEDATQWEIDSLVRADAERSGR